MSFENPFLAASSPPGCATQSIDMVVGARLQRRRLDLAMGLEGLSQLTGILPPRSMAIEAGEVRPTAAELYQLAASLGLAISDLFRDVVPPIE